MSIALTAVIEELHATAARKLIELINTQTDPALLARLIATALRFKVTTRKDEGTEPRQVNPDGEQASHPPHDNAGEQAPRSPQGPSHTAPATSPVGKTRPDPHPGITPRHRPGPARRPEPAGLIPAPA